MLRLLTEYDEKEHMRRVKRDARQEGEEIGELKRRREVIYDFLGKLGEIPMDIYKCVEAQEDVETLRQWYIAAPQVESFDAFRKKIKAPVEGGDKL